MKFLYLIFFLFTFFVTFRNCPSKATENSSSSQTILFIDDGYVKVYPPTTIFGSWKYPLKLWRESLQELMLIFNPVERHHFKLELAHKRLLEIQDFCERGKCHKTGPLIDKYKKYLEEVFVYMERSKEQDEKIESLVTSFYVSFPQYKRVIERIKFLSKGEGTKEIITLEQVFNDQVKNAKDYWGLDQLIQFQTESIKK